MRLIDGDFPQAYTPSKLCSGRLLRPHLWGCHVPPKIRELKESLERAGFVERGGKGSHRNYVHPSVSKPVTLSGNLGDDAKHYQVRAVRLAIQESNK